VTSPWWIGDCCCSRGFPALVLLQDLHSHVVRSLVEGGTKMMSMGLSSSSSISSTSCAAMVCGVCFSATLGWERRRRLCGINYSRLLSPSPVCAPVPVLGM
jgi:hypothetical protein